MGLVGEKGERFIGIVMIRRKWDYVILYNWNGWISRVCLHVIFPLNLCYRFCRLSSVCVGVVVFHPLEEVFTLITWIFHSLASFNNDKVPSSATNQEYSLFLSPFFQIDLHNEDQNETRKVIKADFSFPLIRLITEKSSKDIDTQIRSDKHWRSSRKTLIESEDKSECSERKNSEKVLFSFFFHLLFSNFA